MASHQAPTAAIQALGSIPSDHELTTDEGWDLIFSLFGSAQHMYADVGGAEAWLRSERAAWADKEALR